MHCLLSENIKKNTFCCIGIFLEILVKLFDNIYIFQFLCIYIIKTGRSVCLFICLSVCIPLAPTVLVRSSWNLAWTLLGTLVCILRVSEHFKSIETCFFFSKTFGRRKTRTHGQSEQDASAKPEEAKRPNSPAVLAGRSVFDGPVS